MKIVVDADACPVKGIILDEVAPRGIEVILVASICHEIQSAAGVRVVRVDNVPQAADIAVANLTSPGDIVVTGDFGLAAMALARRARAISLFGKPYRDEDMPGLLEERNLSARFRRGGGRTKGPRARTKEDDEQFRRGLVRMLDG